MENRKLWTEKDTEVMLKYKAQGLTAKEIAKAMGWSYTSIYRRMAMPRGFKKYKTDCMPNPFKPCKKW